MKELEFKISPKTCGIILGILFIAIMYRAYTYDGRPSEALKQAVLETLSRIAGAETRLNLKEFDARYDLDNIDSLDREAMERDVQKMAARIDARDIVIEKLSVSQPLLVWTRERQVTIYVEYSLPTGARNSKYLQFTYDSVDGWIYQSESEQFGYFYNFL